MNDAPTIINISSNIWLILTFVVVLYVFFYFLFIKWLKFDKVAWKRIDYVWLAFAVLGLIGSSGDSRRLFASNLMEDRKTFIKHQYRSVYLQADIGTDGVLCLPRERSQYSPENFDDIEAQRKEACKYFTELKYLLPTSLDDNANAVSLPVIEPPNISDPILSDYFRRYNSTVENYLKERKDFDEFKKLQERSNLELTASFFSPILLAIALALRIVKAKGEILIELESKRKSESNIEVELLDKTA